MSNRLLILIFVALTLGVANAQPQSPVAQPHHSDRKLQSLLAGHWWDSSLCLIRFEPSPSDSGRIVTYSLLDDDPHPSEMLEQYRLSPRTFTRGAYTETDSSSWSISIPTSHDLVIDQISQTALTLHPITDSTEKTEYRKITQKEAKSIFEKHAKAVAAAKRAAEIEEKRRARLASKLFAKLQGNWILLRGWTISNASLRISKTILNIRGIFVGNEFINENYYIASYSCPEDDVLQLRYGSNPSNVALGNTTFRFVRSDAIEVVSSSHMGLKSSSWARD